MLLYPRPICQEEEGGFSGGGAGGWSRDRRTIRSREVKSTEHEGEQRIGEDGEPEKLPAETVPEGFSEKAFLRVMEERQNILDMKLSAWQKKRFLETTRYPLAAVTGRQIPFKTEEVVKWMLIYSMAVVIILALLTAFAHLEKEVTISFVGTVMGGLIATVAQKLGRIGM